MPGQCLRGHATNCRLAKRQRGEYPCCRLETLLTCMLAAGENARGWMDGWQGNEAHAMVRGTGSHPSWMAVSPPWKVSAPSAAVLFLLPFVRSLPLQISSCGHPSGAGYAAQRWLRNQASAAADRPGRLCGKLQALDEMTAHPSISFSHCPTCSRLLPMAKADAVAARTASK